MAATRKRRIVQWLFLTALLLVVLLAATFVLNNNHDRQIGAIVHERGGFVREGSRLPASVEKAVTTVFGAGFSSRFNEVIDINFEVTKVANSDLQNLMELDASELHHIWRLNLENTAISDDGLRDVHRLDGLKRLILEGTQVT